MNRTVLLIILLLFITPLSTIGISEHPYEYDGDTVYIDDNNVFLSATPHTISASGWVTFTLLSKQYSGDVDVVFGFNTTQTKPTKAEIWCNYTHTEYIKVNITTEQEVEINNQTFIIDLHTYEYQPVERTYFDWKPFERDFTKISYNFKGMNKWFLLKDININADKEYKLRIWLDVPFSGLNTSTGKYWYAIKPSGETLSQSIQNDHFYAIDPWWNVSWAHYKYLGICLANDSYQMQVDIWNASGTINCSGNVRGDFGDIRFTDIWNNTLYHWRENYTYQTFARFWVKVPDNVTSVHPGILMYYDNPTATDNSDGNNTWIFFDDFPGAAVDAFKWATLAGVTVANSNAVLDGTDYLKHSVPNYGDFQGGRFKMNVSLQDTDGYLYYIVATGGDANNRIQVYQTDGANLNKYVLNNRKAGVATETQPNIWSDCRVWNRWEVLWANVTAADSAHVIYHQTWGSTGVEETVTHVTNVPILAAEVWHGLWSPTASTMYINWSLVGKYNYSEPYFCNIGEEQSQPVPTPSTNLSAFPISPYNESYDICPCDSCYSFNVSNNFGSLMNATVYLSHYPDFGFYPISNGAFEYVTNGTYSFCMNDYDFPHIVGHNHTYLNVSATNTWYNVTFCEEHGEGILGDGVNATILYSGHYIMRYWASVQDSSPAPANHRMAIAIFNEEELIEGSYREVEFASRQEEKHIAGEIAGYYSVWDNISYRYIGDDTDQAITTNGTWSDDNICAYAGIFKQDSMVMELNKTYYWYVNVTEVGNVSNYNNSAIFWYHTANETSTCNASTGGTGSSVGLVGIIGIFGIIGWFLRRRRRYKVKVTEEYVER